jgi:hypothetical protein
VPLSAVTPSSLKSQPDDKVRRESFAFSAAWRAFRSKGDPLPDGLSPKSFLSKWQAVYDEMKRRGIKGAFGPPEMPKDLQEEKSFSPPSSVRSAAKRGLEMRDKYNRGGTDVGIARARDLSGGKNIPLSTIRRMNRFFIRHEKNKDSGPEDGRNGKIAWLLWGGTPAQRWVRGILRREGLLEAARLAEAIKPVKVPENVYFQIEDRKASYTKELQPGSRPVPNSGRKWAIIVADQSIIRRTKQEARRLGDPKYHVTGGELRALGPGGEENFLVVTSWIWKGTPRGEPVQEGEMQEGAYFTQDQLKVIGEVQEHLHAGKMPDAELIELFLGVHPVAEPESVQESVELLPQAVSAIEAVSRVYALDGEQRSEAAESAWSELGLSYLAVDQAYLVEALESTKTEEEYLDALGARVIQAWPGFLSFDRMMSEDRILVEAEQGLLVRVCSGELVDIRSTWESLTESEPEERTGVFVDQEDLCAVGLNREDIPGDQRDEDREMVHLPESGGVAEGTGRTAPVGFADADEPPAEVRRRIIKHRESLTQGSLFP